MRNYLHVLLRISRLSQPSYHKGQGFCFLFFDSFVFMTFLSFAASLPASLPLLNIPRAAEHVEIVSSSDRIA